ncbi:MAG: sugar phosphate nucleotidyltransferase, partial [Planctomycetaceae bacterium]
WYQGTADAVRKNLRYVEQYGIDYVLILSGDQLYRMDYGQMFKTHQQSGADVTIAAMPVDRQAARGFGIMRLDETGRIVGFLEKPKTDDELKMVRTDPAWLDAHGIASRGRDCLASMGIYLFNRKVLVDVLKKTDYQDFGKEVFPASIRARRVQVHPFDGYWEDIGTIRSYYEANLELARPNPPFEFAAQDDPIYTHAQFLPPSRIDGASITGSLISDGCVIEPGAVVENSIIGLRCRIGRNAAIKRSILMGVDFYQTREQSAFDQEREGLPRFGVGEGSRIEGAIIDKNCRIGKNVRVRPPKDVDADTDTEIKGITIRDGIPVVPKGSVLPDGWSL